MLGIARFAYTPLLPLMQAQGGLASDQGAWLAGINYLGYLAGALIAASTSDMVVKDRLYRIGIWVAVLSTTGMALTTDWRLWAAFRFVAGLSSAAGLLLGSGLILNWLLRHHHKRGLGLYFSGIGLGIYLCQCPAGRSDGGPFRLAGPVVGIRPPRSGPGSAGLGLVATPGEYTALYRQRPAPREQTAISPVSASLVGGVLLCRYRLCGQCDLYRIHRRATAWSRRPGQPGVYAHRSGRHAGQLSLGSVSLQVPLDCRHIF